VSAMSRKGLNPTATFVVAVNDRGVYERTFLQSTHFKQDNLSIHTKTGYPSASLAYNEGLAEAEAELVIFAHQDVFFPENWLQKLLQATEAIQTKDRNWGVIGCFGVTRTNQRYGHLYSTGLRSILGAPLERPMPVQTLDEMVLILRKSSGLSFDEHLPGFHLYGTDICMQAARRGMVNYAIDAFCIHNSSQTVHLPAEFFRCYRYLRMKYWNELPIQTSCIRITKSNSHYFRYRLDGLIARFTRRKGNIRHADPAALWQVLKHNV